MRRTLTILCLLAVSSLFIACGEKNTNITNANAQSNAAATGASGTGAADAGVGPEHQGIGGTGEKDANAVNGNTYTTPPGFNKNGDRGSASNVSNTH